MLKKPSRLTVISLISVICLCPAAIYLMTVFTDRKSYYISAVLILIFALLPFFIYFEKRKARTGEIVILAVMTAIAVSSRSAMMFLPQIKPTCAIVMITAIAFGPNAGFLTGALSMFLSNFLFGQGIYTPFQMFGMGLAGFICGIIFYGKKAATSRLAVSLTGAILCLTVYGITVDSCSVLMLSSSVSLKSALPFYLSGLPFNIIHSVTTGILLFVIQKPMEKKFSRLRKKYGIFDKAL